MASTRVVSFDMDGTITDLSFADSVWLEGVPRLYAIKNGVSLEDAVAYVKREYDKVGKKRLEWYDPAYWMEKFGLDVSPGEVLGFFRHRVRVFPEVNEVLEECKDRGFRLIMVTNAHKEFVDFELEMTGIGAHFERVFSATFDFGLVKKTTRVYQKVCSALGVSPGEVVHVGDDRMFDFVVPSRLGIRAFYLDRTGKHSGDSVVHSLKEFMARAIR